jgi:hypothetical protein
MGVHLTLKVPKVFDVPSECRKVALESVDEPFIGELLVVIEHLLDEV